MFQDIATTREGWHIGTTVMMGVMAVFWWYVGFPLWVVAIVGIASIAGAIRYFIPVSYELVVNDAGLSWGRVGKEKKMRFDWAQIHLVRYVEVERELDLDIGRAFMVTIPQYFLRSDQKREDFLAAIHRLSPPTVIKRI